jgi:hypothetical protein
MMNTWALLKNGTIVNTVTTTLHKEHLQECHPNYEVQLLDDVPLDVCERYPYWDERP